MCRDLPPHHAVIPCYPHEVDVLLRGEPGQTETTHGRGKTRRPKILARAHSQQLSKRRRYHPTNRKNFDNRYSSLGVYDTDMCTDGKPILVVWKLALRHGRAWRRTKTFLLLCGRFDSSRKTMHDPLRGLLNSTDCFSILFLPSNGFIHLSATATAGVMPAPVQMSSTDAATFVRRVVRDTPTQHSKRQAAAGAAKQHHMIKTGRNNEGWAKGRKNRHVSKCEKEIKKKLAPSPPIARGGGGGCPTKETATVTLPLFGSGGAKTAQHPFSSRSKPKL